MRDSMSLVLFWLALAGASACTAEQSVVGHCDPYAPEPSAQCRAQFAADAGTDASDGGGGGSQLRAECAGRCLKRAWGDYAGPFEEPPLSVWVGPKGLMPPCCPGSTNCPLDADAGPSSGATADVPIQKYRVFNQLIAPPAKCEPCECGASEGTCTGLPEKIEIRAGLLCDPNAPSLPFDGPPGWDGSCSNEGALPAGQLCNGAFCAQSVWSPPLPGPTTESCTPKSATPKATIEKADWALGALACMGEQRNEECGDRGPFCLNDPGPGWLHCVAAIGDIKICPNEYNESRFVMYPEDAVDDRGCEACSCGAPVGSGCLGKVPLYSDGACSSFVNNVLVSSMGEGCLNLQPPGIALGSNEVTGLGYMPGTCSASGGAPKGSAAPDLGHQVTFCCASFFNID